MDRLVCALISVLCSYDIVKRVVTVKQVRPSFLINSGGVRSGLGMGMCLPMRERRQGLSFAHSSQDQRAESGDQRKVRAFRLSCLTSAL
jgi:hypothetical protein